MRRRDRLWNGLLIWLTLSLPIVADTLTVVPGGTLPTIGQALSLARDGDVVFLGPGVYREGPLVIDKAITLMGDGRAVLDGQGRYQILTVRSAGVTIENLTLQNCGSSFMEDRSAILLDSTSNCRVIGNRIVNAFFGIYLAQSFDCQIVGNTLVGEAERESNSGNGIHLWYCRDITVAGNRITGHRDGIYFEFVENGEVLNNHSENNLRYGLHFMFSDNCRYLDNLFRHNGAGVAVMYTEHVEMVGNRFENNRGGAAYGILLKDIKDSRISNCIFLGNSIGIYAEGCNRIEITANRFTDNGWAVKIMANCENNRFSGNDFINNAFDVATNGRNNFNDFSGNYWSAYRGYDLNRDGIGDKPFAPVRLFSTIVTQNPPALILLRSLFVDLLDNAERAFPILTPLTLIDSAPHMERILP